MEFFDSHAHYNDPKFSEDEKEVIEAVYNAGITKILNAGYSLETSKKAIQLAEEYDFAYASVRNFT
ncbi:MAG: TatD family hydrolase [Oscillospiraceae bacterium]|nr:TatD family hydrolase [Oscillospiraceae bacterium]